MTLYRVFLQLNKKYWSNLKPLAVTFLFQPNNDCKSMFLNENVQNSFIRHVALLSLSLITHNVVQHDVFHASSLPKESAAAAL